MSEMVERAARAACNAMHGGEAICLSEAERATRTPCVPSNCATAAAVRAALLAALDPEDEKLVALVARSVFEAAVLRYRSQEDWREWEAEMLEQGRAAIAALKKHAQGEPASNADQS